jgi:hypothetical protein
MKKTTLLTVLIITTNSLFAQVDFQNRISIKDYKNTFYTYDYINEKSDNLIKELIKLYEIEYKSFYEGKFLFTGESIDLNPITKYEFDSLINKYGHKGFMLKKLIVKNKKNETIHQNYNCLKIISEGKKIKDTSIASFYISQNIEYKNANKIIKHLSLNAKPYTFEFETLSSKKLKKKIFYRSIDFTEYEYLFSEIHLVKYPTYNEEPPLWEYAISDTSAYSFKDKFLRSPLTQTKINKEKVTQAKNRYYILDLDKSENFGLKHYTNEKIGGISIADLVLSYNRHAELNVYKSSDLKEYKVTHEINNNITRKNINKLKLCITELIDENGNIVFSEKSKIGFFENDKEYFWVYYPDFADKIPNHIMLLLGKQYTYYNFFNQNLFKSKKGKEEMLKKEVAMKLLKPYFIE